MGNLGRGCGDFVEGVAEGGCRLLWRGLQNFVEGVGQFSERGYVKRKAFFSDFFSG